MVWKNWPYWLRGGWIGLVFGVIIVSIQFGLPCNPLPVAGNCESSFLLWIGIITFIISMPSYFLLGLIPHLRDNQLISIISLLISWIIIGALGGILFKEIKSIKQK